MFPTLGDRSRSYDFRASRQFVSGREPATLGAFLGAPIGTLAILSQGRSRGVVGHEATNTVRWVKQPKDLLAIAVRGGIEVLDAAEGIEVVLEPV